MGVTELVWEETSIYLAIELSLREISYFLYARARSFARADDAKIVRSRDANAKLGNHLNIQYASNSRGGGVVWGGTPYKVLMRTSCQPGCVFREFGLKQGIDVIIFCLKQPAHMLYELNYSKIFTRSF